MITQLGFKVIGWGGSVNIITYQNKIVSIYYLPNEHQFCRADSPEFYCDNGNMNMLKAIYENGNK